LDAALQAAGFRREALPAVDGATVDTLAAGTEREAAELTAELGRAERETQALAVESAPLLAQIENAVGTEQRLLQAEQEGARTETTVVLAGWVPTSDMPALERCVREITGGRCAMEATAPDEVPEEQVPVLLRHSRLLRPFSMLVSAYGLPRYREIAPTLFVAISYVLMFGMMFGDTGQGLVLALAGLAMLLAGRSVRMRDLGLLLLTCGISSAGFGVIYGSCFGLAQFKQYALWHDPLEGNPLSLMLAAVGIGVVMISLGLLLNIVNRFRRGDIAGGFLDKFGVGGMLFYWGGLALLAKYAAGHFDRLPASALTLCLVLPLAAWVLREPVQSLRARHTGGALAALAESLVGAFETVLAYFANTISFVRLAAYALSHAALLMATFVLADSVSRMHAGGALSVAVIVAGNLVAMLLEGVVAAVQTLRLEYYEFFGKFFAGNGQPFRPFCLSAEEG
jgi:V/A-type H+-transporting ATPase subunit I